MSRIFWSCITPISGIDKAPADSTVLGGPMNWGFPERTEFWNLLWYLLDWIPFFWQNAVFWVLVISVTSPVISGGSRLSNSGGREGSAPVVHATDLHKGISCGNESKCREARFEDHRWLVCIMNARGFECRCHLFLVDLLPYGHRNMFTLIFGDWGKLYGVRTVSDNDSVWFLSLWSLMFCIGEDLYFGPYATQKMGAVCFFRNVFRLRNCQITRFHDPEFYTAW